MADGCLGKITQFVLFITNFLIFVLGCASFGVAIWVLVDQPSFFDIIDQAENVCNGTAVIDDSCEGITSSLEIFGSATYIMITVAVLVVIVSFFGCCGAWKESKCMLGTYFTIVLALFIVMLVGAILGYSGNLEDQIEKPFMKALKLYRDQPSNEAEEAYKSVWNEAQKELLCCGVDSVADWDDDKFGFKNPVNKPSGCCFKNRQGEELIGTQQQDCLVADLDKDSPDYYFEGCYSKMKELVEENQEIVVGVAIGVVVLMFLNMLFAFSLCMMVES